jgi:general secretion pathway protein G
MKYRGFSLIELVLVLAVIAVLAGAITPLASSYIDQARTTRATAEARSIADAIRLYQRDVGEFPIFLNTTEAINDTPSATLIATANGSTPLDGIGLWTTDLSTTSLELYMNANYLGRTITVEVGRTHFNGPYVGNLESDPWGNKYYLTAANLRDDSPNYAFILSAGPDGSLNTFPDQAKSSPFSVGGDDIVTVIR